MDACYPEGPGGPLVLVGRGRDLVTGSAGTPTTAAQADVEVGVHFERGPVVTSMTTSPPVDVTALIGRLASTGFRAVIDSDTPAVPGTLVYLLLDEIPAATLVGGYSIMHAVRRGDLQSLDSGRRRPPGPALQVPDLCAGFQTGGVIMTEIGRSGVAPHVTGPDAPDLDDPGDPWAWHDAPPVPANGMRRRRRIDLTPDPIGTVDIDALFRDSHMTPDGRETVIHEYTVQAKVDAAHTRVLECRATPRVLPWLECPQAAASAARLVDTPLAHLRTHVRAQFVGPTTCTHLNDTLRALQDVPHLGGLVPER